MSKINFIFRRPLFYAAIFLCVSIAAARFLAPAFYNYIPQEDISRIAAQKSVDVSLRGDIISVVEEKDTFYHERQSTFILACKSAVWGEGTPHAARGKVRVSVKNPAAHFQYGDIVDISGQLALPPRQRNPGGFDYRAYLDRQGIHALLFSGKKSQARVLASGNGNPMMAISYRFRHFLSRQLSLGFTQEDAAFLKALLLGEKSDVSVEFEELFIKTGTLHILAVSGFNVGFLSAALLFFLLPLRLAKNLRWLTVLAGIWIYCLVVGWQAPLVRASVMATIMIMGKLLGRKADLLNSLGLAAILILAINVKTFFDIGFQLSFLAVAGLALFMPVFVKQEDKTAPEKESWRSKASVYAEELFWVSFVATMITLPVTVQSFYIVSPLSLLANMVVVPLSFLLFFCGLIFFFTFWWMPKTIFFIPALMKTLMQVFTYSLSWIGQLPYSCVTVGKLCFPLEILLVAGVAYLFFERRLSNRWVRAACMVFFCLNIFLAQEALRHFNRQFTMTVLDVAQGDSIYFEFPGGGNLLMDAGKGAPADKGRRVVVPYLKSKGVRRLDVLAISHPQADHIGGMEAVLSECRVINVLDSGRFYQSHLYDSLKEAIDKEHSRCWTAARGGEMKGFGKTAIRILNPSQAKEASKNINNDSVILKIVFGRTSFLLTGDIEAPAMRDLMDSGENLKSDVLKVPHHGAKLDKTSFDFIQEVSPSISAISVGERNPFKHPRPETLDALSSIPGNLILRTDQQGAVSLVSDGINVVPTAPR